jgi:hypothetical protein
MKIKRRQNIGSSRSKCEGEEMRKIKGEVKEK